VGPPRAGRCLSVRDRALSSRRPLAPLVIAVAVPASVAVLNGMQPLEDVRFEVASVKPLTCRVVLSRASFIGFNDLINDQMTQ